jgi:dihydrofolate reductase
MYKMRFNLIVAMCRNNGIGYKGKLPWHLPQDLEYFAKLTKGEGLNAVIMGNNTWQHLPIHKNNMRGLVKRDNFVLSRTENFDILINHDRLVKTFKSIDALVEYVEKNNTYEEVWVIGGAQIYKQLLDLKKIERCYVTYIDADFECDAFFPLLDSAEWKEVERVDRYSTEYECSVNYIVYTK